jgi:hypothetical protein
MGAISVDSHGHAAQERTFSAKAVGRAAILLGALGVALVGVYWLASAPAGGGGETSPVTAVVPPAQPAPTKADGAATPAEPLLKAPAATCVDGRPASADVPADACR